jgi:hypothetical protein
LTIVDPEFGLLVAVVDVVVEVAATDDEDDGPPAATDRLFEVVSMSTNLIKPIN